MDASKATPQEIYQVLEQQKKLQEMRAMLTGILDKVNQSINSITVENFELTNSQIERIEDEIEPVEIKPTITQTLAEQEKRAEEINQQFIDLELKFAHYEDETDDEELDL